MKRNPRGDIASVVVRPSDGAEPDATEPDGTQPDAAELDATEPDPTDEAVEDVMADARAWARVLAHRRREDPAAVDAVVERFRAAGVRPAEVAAHLEDAGDRLYRAAAAGEEGWAGAFGGERAVALLAAEVGALMSHLVARAASVRSVCVDALLDEFSAVTVAGALGVARQKVYELARPSVDPDFLTTTPWRST